MFQRAFTPGLSMCYGGRALKTHICAAVIAVGLASGAHCQPANDDFADAEVLPGASGSVTGTNVDSTFEEFDPYVTGNDGSGSVWYEYVALDDGDVLIDTFGSNFDTLLGVYTGDAINGFTLVADDDDSGSVVQSEVLFSATAGTTYYVVVDGYGDYSDPDPANHVSSFGSIVLNYSGPESPCSYGLTPVSQSVSGAGGNGTVSVTSEIGCPWDAQSNQPWVTFPSGSNGTGSGALNFSVAPNPGAERSATITVEGATHVITQQIACSYTVAPASQSIPAGGGAGSFNVTAGGGCSWSALSSHPWITFVSGGSGSGNGTVNYNVAANTGSERSATITLQGQQHIVTQAGCVLNSLTTSPTSQMDLVAAFTSVKATGTNTSIKMSVSQSTGALAAPSVMVTFYAVDSASVPCTLPALLGQTSTKAGKAPKPGKSAKPVKVKAKLPALPPGKQLMAIVDLGNVIQETNKLNNVAFGQAF